MNTHDKAGLRAQLRASRAVLDDSFMRQAGSQLARTVLGWMATSCGLTPSDGLVTSDGLAASDGGEPTPVAGAHGGPAVCAFLSAGSEPPTSELLESLDAAGYRVFVPVCEPNFQLSWVRWSPGAVLVPSSLAPVMEPVGERRRFVELGSVQAVLVPALAVDATGARLGQGGGYYDRFLANSGAPAVAAVVYEREFLTAGAVPIDSLDVRVDYAITPSAVHAAQHG